MVEFESDDEILELAIARELDAYRFYRALAARAEKPEMGKVFEVLAEEELEHKAKLDLELMKSGKVVETSQEATLIEDEQDLEDFESTLDIDYKDMLILGMQKEEAAFRFYVDLVARITNQGSRETLLALAQEEVKHKLRFEVEYDEALKQK